jgi:multimeric flavodoxin WrbA
MRILAIYGNPKRDGFVHSALDYVCARLGEKGAQVDQLRLVDADIRDCTGCFSCMRSGRCVIPDDINEIYERLRAADGYVTGASVRNGTVPALFKRFYERITYPIVFTRDLRDKHVLSIGAVGMATGKKNLGNFLQLHKGQVRLTDYLFFKTGIPTELTVGEVQEKLDGAADRFSSELKSKKDRSILTRVVGMVDDFVVRNFMLKRDSAGLYEYITGEWKKKGLM